jgi:tetratricopeptide (TPR) repeat protein
VIPGIVLLALLAQAGAGVPNLAREAHEDFGNGRYVAAREKLKGALAISPENPALWSLLGLTDSKLNDLDEAIASFRRAVKLAPDDAQSWFNLGALYGRKNEQAAAVEVYRTGLQFDSNNASANRNYAFLLMSLNRLPEAIPPLEKLKGQNAGDLSARLALIGCFAKLGNQGELDKEVQGALELPDFTLDQHLKIARMLVREKQPGAARSILEHALTISDHSAEAHFGLGLLEMEADRFEEAVRHFGRAAQIDPASAPYSMRLAEALILWEHYGTAIEFLRAVQPRFGSLPDYQYKLGLAYYGAHRFPQAIEQLEGVARENPKLDRVQFFLGNSYSSTGDLPRAEQYLRQAIALEPRNGSYYAALAQVLRKSNDDRNAEAIANLEKALAIDPADVESKHALALCYERARDYNAALALFQQVVAGQPNLTSAHVALARIYYKLRKKTEGDRESRIVAELQAKEQAKQSAIRNSARK